MRSLTDKAEYVEKKKKELGLKSEQLSAAQNSGINRTKSKKRLLKAIADEAKSQGRAVPFPAAY
ncbi:hypothetical protein RYZ26_06895 [Terasakiella sp. A23]|uniref:hypothetical protein n=1 Tax=Terasakiella sp. FCG-A23 TaxID=3080561 RepID=UPI00295330D4|nr:hypothetical protein [Terasakiella sp. A23]MDV7339312.1 hypothetical protein [Terasakiella sp. A23]